MYCHKAALYKSNGDLFFSIIHHSLYDYSRSLWVQVRLFSNGRVREISKQNVMVRKAMIVKACQDEGVD